MSLRKQKTTKKQATPKTPIPKKGRKKRNVAQAKIKSDAGFGGISKNEIDDAVAEMKQKMGENGIKKIRDFCPNQIRRDVITAVANKIEPSRIADAIDELLNGKRYTECGIVPDNKAIEAGVKLYCLLMQIVQPKKEEDNKDSEIEKQIEARIAESSVAFQMLQRKLEQQKQIIEAEIIS